MNIIKAENPEKLLNNELSSQLVKFFFAINHLKSIFRRGWLLKGIPENLCESVAEHTFGAAFLAMLFGKTEFTHLNLEKVIMMALFHDLGEIYAGDIIPSDYVSEKEKHRVERDAVICLLDNFEFRDEFMAIWEEFNAGKTPEAQFVNQIDKLEMVLQASVYEHQGHGNLEEFFSTGKTQVSDPRLVLIIEELRRLRQQGK